MTYHASEKLIAIRRSQKAAAALSKYDPRDAEERSPLAARYQTKDKNKVANLRFMYSAARSELGGDAPDQRSEGEAITPIGRLFRAAEAFRKSAHKKSLLHGACETIVTVHDERLKWLQDLQEADRADELEGVRTNRQKVVQQMASVLKMAATTKAIRDQQPQPQPQRESAVVQERVAPDSGIQQTMSVLSHAGGIVSTLQHLHARLEAARRASGDLSASLGDAAAEAARLVAVFGSEVKQARSNLVQVTDTTLDDISEAGKLVEDAAEKLPASEEPPPLSPGPSRKSMRKLTTRVLALNRLRGSEEAIEDLGSPEHKALADALDYEESRWQCGAIVSALDDTLVSSLQEVTDIVHQVSEDVRSLKSLKSLSDCGDCGDWTALAKMCTQTMQETSDQVMSLVQSEHRSSLRQALEELSMVNVKMKAIVKLRTLSKVQLEAPSIEAVVSETPVPASASKPSPEWLARKVLRKFLVEQWGSIPEACAAMDPTQAGQVNFNDFQRILWENGYVFNFLSAWYVVAGDEETTVVSARQFLRSLGVDPGLESQLPADASRDVIQLRTFLLARWGSLRRAFDALDMRHRGRLSEEEFDRGIRKMGYPPGPPMAVWQMLCQASDLGGAEVGRETFVAALNASRRSAAMIAGLSQLRPHEHPTSVEKVRLSYDDMMDALWRLGYLDRGSSPSKARRRAKQPLRNMSDRIWKEKDEFLSVAEFLVQSCGGAAKAFDYFDISRTGKINAREFAEGMKCLVYTQPYTSAWKTVANHTKGTVAKDLFVERVEVCPLVATFWEALRAQKTFLQQAFAEAVAESPTQSLSEEAFSSILAKYGCEASAQRIWQALTKSAGGQPMSLDALMTGLRSFLPRSERQLDLALFLLARCGRVDMAFSYMDEQKTGKVAATDMANALYRFGYTGSPVETSTLLRETCDDNIITQLPFEEAMYTALAILEADKEKLEARKERDQKAALSVLLSELADFYRRRCGTLAMAFASMDVDNLNWLDSRDLRGGMKRLRYDGNWQVAWRAIVGESRRKVTKKQFLECFRESAEESQAVSDLVEFLCNSCGTIQRAYLTLDQTATGSIDVLQLEVGLRDMGYEGDVRAAWRELVGANGLGLVLSEHKLPSYDDPEVNSPSPMRPGTGATSKHETPANLDGVFGEPSPMSLPKIVVTQKGNRDSIHRQPLRKFQRAAHWHQFGSPRETSLEATLLDRTRRGLRAHCVNSGLETMWSRYSSVQLH
eukprot:TRINITY_DN49334_c0_g1_i1.p1 TRINITY_DN49334_c0_g1~~TRINITY_DN49334_c0_g1_i1.p1  ORF type:complete len:1234 (+),score=292.22 TRINITY_DN49334_c0_g1_i1:175-3876(+)